MTKSASTVRWIQPEKDFEELFSAGKYGELSSLSEENLDLLFLLFRDNHTEDLRDSVAFGKVMLSYLQSVFVDSPRDFSIFGAGKLMGYLELLDRFRFSQEQDQMDVSRTENLGSKHLNRIVSLLETHGSVSQSDLAEMLQLQPSTLSEALKKIRKTGFVRSVPFGKYRLYSLTDSGIRYAALLRRREKTDAEFYRLLARLHEYLQNTYWQRCAVRFFDENPTPSQGTVVSPGEHISIYNNDTHRTAKYQVLHILQATTNASDQRETVFSASPCLMDRAAVNQISAEQPA